MDRICFLCNVHFAATPLMPNLRKMLENMHRDYKNFNKKNLGVCVKCPNKFTKKHMKQYSRRNDGKRPKKMVYPALYPNIDEFNGQSSTGLDDVSTNLNPSNTRRPSRKTRTELESEKQRKIILEEDKYLKIMDAGEMGRGIKTEKEFKQWEFVASYTGEVINKEIADSREIIYENIECSYMFYFKYNGSNMCIDATVDDHRLGRLINHSRKKPNLKVNHVVIEGKSRIYFTALKDIPKGEQLFYDYGDYESPLEWLKY